MLFKSFKLRVAAFLLFLTSLLIYLQCFYSQKECRGLLQHASKKRYDVVVVPGLPLENGKWGRIMRGRIYWAKYLYDKGIAKNIMFSGSAVYTPYVEAEVMALYGESIGIPREHIFTETKAEHSTENIFYSYRKALKSGFNTVALASDPFQSKMLAGYVHEHVNAAIDIIPFVSDTLKKLYDNTSDPVIDIQSAYVDNFVALPDRQSLWERLRGTRGLKVDLNAYR